MSEFFDGLGSKAELVWSLLVDQPAWLGAAAMAALFLLWFLSGKARRPDSQSEVKQFQSVTDRQLAEISGRLSAVAEMTAQRQAELSRSLDDRLEHLAGRLNGSLEAFSGRVAEALTETHRQTASATGRLDVRIDTLSHHLSQNLNALTERVGDNLAEAGRRTSDSLTTLNERLGLIESARQSLAQLSSEVVSLQGVMTNKQARGAFGQGRMETIIRDALPSNAYEFQATLSNGKRPDCLIRLPGSSAPIVVDSKFPLEGFEALRSARTADEIKAASHAVREAVGRHVDEIATKYLIAGETQDTALMFVPSESIYAELHERFPDLIQRAFRSRVVVVAPNILMLAVQTVQGVIKDQRMRDQASVIQREVGSLLGDVGRLVERIQELERHFGLSAAALERISVSAEKISRRGQRLQTLELDEAEPAE
jgi:DNA recombination protein RmuC